MEKINVKKIGCDKRITIREETIGIWKWKKRVYKIDIDNEGRKEFKKIIRQKEY